MGGCGAVGVEDVVVGEFDGDGYRAGAGGEVDQVVERVGAGDAVGGFVADERTVGGWDVTRGRYEWYWVWWM